MSTATETRRCRTCGTEIPAERLEILPHTQTCTEHSEAQAYTGYMVPNASKGTALELQFVPNNKEAQRIARRAHRRSR